MKLAFIINEKTCKTAFQQALSAKADALGLFSTITILKSTYQGETISLSKEFGLQYDYLISVGGDGTLNEVVNGLLQAHQNQPQIVLPIIGIITQGTANDFIKSLNSDGQVDTLFHLIKQQHYQQIDVGKLTCHLNKKPTVKYFINIADIGFGADVVQRMQHKRSLFGANFTYLKAILRTFLQYKPTQLTLTLDNKDIIKRNTLAIAIANGRFFGSGLCIAPHANLSDGKFAITHIGNISMFDFLFHLKSLKKGRKISHPEAQYLSAKTITVSANNPHCAIEADGEFMGYLPVQITVLPQTITLLSR